MFSTNSFEGMLNNKKIEDFTNQLDYSIESLEERLKLVKSILYTQCNGEELDEYFEMFFDQSRTPIPHFKTNINANDSLSENNYVIKNLEHITNYLLFCKEALIQNDYSDYPYLDSKDRLNIKKREQSFEQLEEQKTADGISVLDEKLKEDIGTKKYLQYKVDKKDIQDIEEIRKIQEEIDKIKNEILPNLENKSVIRSYIDIMKDLKYQQVAIKKSIKRPIEFKKLSRSEIGYHIELSEVEDYHGSGLLVSLDKDAIHLGNTDHIVNILSLYSDLKMDSHDKLNSDIKYILEILENTIDNANLTDCERDVIVMKIDGCKAKDIIDNMKLKYDLDWSEEYLSKVWKRVIPRKIADKYLEDCLDYIYTFEKKGKYKTCSKCNEPKIMNNRNFSLNKDSADGFHSQCKKCRNEKREEI